MTKVSLFSLLAFGLVLFSCKKEDPAQIINNNYYQNDDNESSVNMKKMMEYGLTDSTAKITFTYYNNEKAKISQMIYNDVSGPTERLEFFYDSEGNPDYFQILSLPGNTLTSQGEFILDANNNVSKSIIKTATGDTVATIKLTYTYVANQYKISSRIIVDSSGDEDHDYFEYNQDGNLYKNTSYETGVSGLYKSEEVESSFSNVVNSFPNLYLYTLVLNSSVSRSASLYYSTRVPNVIRTQRYTPTGALGSFTSTIIEGIEADADNNITNFIDGSSPIYVKY